MFDEACHGEHALLQDPAFGEALRLCGQHPVTLPSGLLLLRRRILRQSVLMLPRACPPPDLHQQLARAGLHRLPLILSPEAPCDLPPALRLFPAQDLAQIDLKSTQSERRAALHPKWRNQLRKAECSKMHVMRASLPADPNHPVLVLEAQQAKSRGYATWPPSLTAAFAKVAPSQCNVFTARLEGKIAAYMLIITHGHRATYQIGHINKKGKSLCAHNLLIWKASNWLASRGITTLDLGVVDHRNVGLNRFKQRSGAQMRPTGGTWLRWAPF